MNKATLLKSISIGLFVLLMAFNITMTLNNEKAAGVDLSLSSLTALAQGGGEEDPVFGCPIDFTCDLLESCIDGECVPSSQTCADDYTLTFEPEDQLRICGGVGCSIQNGVEGIEDQLCGS